MFNFELGSDKAQMKLAIILLAKKKITIEESKTLEDIAKGYEVDIGRYNKRVDDMNARFEERE